VKPVSSSATFFWKSTNASVGWPSSGSKLSSTVAGSRASQPWIRTKSESTVG